MKILLFTDNHSPTGGAEQYFFELKERLKKDSQFDVFSFGFGIKEEHGRDFHILKAPQKSIPKLFWRLLFNPLVYFKIRRFLKKMSPDVVHLHNNKQYTVTVLRALKGYRVVQTVHDYSYICPTAQNIHKDKRPCATGVRLGCFWQHQVKFNILIYAVVGFCFFKTKRIARSVIDTYLAPSPMLVSAMQQNGFNHTIYMPPFIKQPDAVTVTPNPNEFLFAGNLGLHKGTKLLLDEFALAVKKNPSLVLNIAGSGPEENNMRQQVTALGIRDNVRFLGWQKDLKPFYLSCTAVIFPSIGLESFGLVITDAMANARPVIGVNYGTSAWLIAENKTGLLFDPLKRGDLAEKILKIKNNLGINAQERLGELFNNDKTMAQLLQIYQAGSRDQVAGSI